MAKKVAPNLGGRPRKYRKAGGRVSITISLPANMLSRIDKALEVEIAQGRWLDRKGKPRDYVARSEFLVELIANSQRAK